MEDLQVKATLAVTSCVKKKLFTKTDFARMLDMTRVTLNSRLKNGDWRKRELDVIFNETEF
jgi:hypothetical protein